MTHDPSRLVPTPDLPKILKIRFLSSSPFSEEYIDGHVAINNNTEQLGCPPTQIVSCNCKFQNKVTP